ncbi:MAG: MIP/aquaporin family protein [Bacteroidota bacterium]
MTPFIAEFLGTMMLLLLGNGVVANVLLKDTKGHDSGWIVITMGWGIAVFVGVFISADYSGAHLNPAVTLGLFAAGKFGIGPEGQLMLAEVGSYILAQFLGAAVGMTLVWLAYRDHYDTTEDQDAKLATFSTAPAYRNPISNLVTEAIGTFALVFAVLFMVAPELGGEGMEGAKIGLGAIGALPVALLVLGIGLSLGGPTGYAINPARDLGPRIMHSLLPIPRKRDGDWGYAWIPVVGPILGGVIAGVLSIALT